MSRNYSNYSQYLGAQRCCNLQEQGPIGPQGPTGPASIGPKGDTGTTGTTWPQGIPGTSTGTGATGYTGPTGFTGPQGIPGDSVNTGATINMQSYDTNFPSTGNYYYAIRVDTDESKMYYGNIRISSINFS